MLEQATVNEIAHDKGQPKVTSTQPTSNVQNGIASGLVVQPAITSEEAARKASSYLGKHVSMFFGAGSPVFFPLEQPIWQVTVFFLRYHIGPVNLAFLDLDAKTGEVTPLAEDEIQKIRKRADAFVKYSTLSTTT